MAVAFLVACGGEDPLGVIVDVDTTAVTLAPDTLFLELSTASGEGLARNTTVSSDGVTRIHLVPGDRTPDEAQLVVTAYAGRAVVGRAPAQLIVLRPGSLEPLIIVLE